ncbi:VOC family protein [Alphaproteobacteria bacterium]|nr:VOC family protein [Alphaproteobacteria bacterium]
MGDFKSPALQNAQSVKKVGSGPFAPSGILHFTISVGDLDRAIEFYTTIIGAILWRRISYSAFMCVGDNFFVLSNIGYHRRPNNAGHCLIHNAFIVQSDAFDQAVNYIESKDIEIVLYEDSGHESFPGRHAYFQDPFGNAVEIVDLIDIGIGATGDPPIPGWNKNRIRNNYFGRNQFEGNE